MDRTNKNPTFFVRYFKSTLWKRVDAYLVDLFSVGILSETFIFTFRNFATRTWGEGTLWSAMGEIRPLIFFLTYFGYFLTSFYLGEGKTLGNMLKKLIVVPSNEHHRSLTLVESFNRTSALLVSHLAIFVPFTLSLFRKDHKNLVDLISGTICVLEEQIEKVDALEDFPIERNKVIKFPEDPTSRLISKSFDKVA